MFPKKIPSVLAFGGMITACLSAWAPAASAGSPSAVEQKAVFAPIESIRYDFGSKSTSGYLVEQAGACHVILMVFETIEPDESPPASAARVRLVLLPGQIAGLDSEDGRTLNFTCGEEDDAACRRGRAGQTCQSPSAPRDRDPIARGRA